LSVFLCGGSEVIGGLFFLYSLATGALADWLGASTALLIMAVGGVAAAALCVVRYPELLR